LGSGGASAKEQGEHDVLLAQKGRAASRNANVNLANANGVAAKEDNVSWCTACFTD